MIDIHCHLMPGVDDGAKDIDEAKRMLQVAKEEGIEKVIVTPHFNSRLKINYDIKFEELRKIAKQEGVMLYKGCEYKLQDALGQKSDLITLADSDYVLIEIVVDFLAEYVLNQIYQLKLSGYEVIIAHPERSFEKKDIEKLIKLRDMNVYFQLTAASIVGAFGRQVQKFSQKLLEKGLCHFIASDAHDDSGRQFYFSEVKNFLNRSYKEKFLSNLLFGQNQEAIINGQGYIQTISPIKENIFKKILKV